tara:strand:- start:1138 stop:1959 length:822 start_codon:yes stop_codon:yes gene_type:complete
MTEETNVNQTEQTEQTEQTPAQTPAQQPNLLSDAPVENTATQDTTETAQETASVEGLPEKFKTVADMAKSYAELEKKVSTQPKAPDQYDFSFTKDIGLETLTEEQQSQTAEVMRSYGITQEQAKGMMSLYADSINEATKQIQQQYDERYPQTDLTVENNKLEREWGADFKNNIQQVKTFADSLPKDMMRYPISETAEGVKMLYNMLQSAQGSNPMNTNYGGTAQSITDVKQKIADLRGSDNYRLPQGNELGDSTRAEIYRLYQQLERMGNAGS